MPSPMPSSLQSPVDDAAVAPHLCRALVIDAEELVALDLRRVLSASPLNGTTCRCDCATGADAALQRLHAFHYDLVILDIRELEGRDDLRDQLKRQGCAVLFATAFPERIAALGLHGHEPVLVKPFSEASAKAQIVACLDQANA